jgi:hypothetical protein
MTISYVFSGEIGGTAAFASTVETVVEGDVTVAYYLEARTDLDRAGSDDLDVPLRGKHDRVRDVEVGALWAIEARVGARLVALLAVVTIWRDVKLMIESSRRKVYS